MSDTQNNYRSIIQAVKATEFDCEIEYLKSIYLARKKVSRPYSYRHFSEELGFGHTNYMHLILTDRRPLTLKAAEKIADAIELKGRQRKFFLLLVEYKQVRDAGIREKVYAKLVETKKSEMVPGLQKGYLEYFSSWENSVLLELVSQNKGKVDLAELHARLWPSITLNRLEKSIEMLISIGFLERTKEQGHYVVATKYIATARNVRSLALVRYHHNMIELARESLLAVHGSRRDISSVTLSAKEEDLEKIKVEIENFRNHILKTYDNSEVANQVYQLNLQLFPFTKRVDEK
jgi:uncharacterized protein (TIGR02147 family)